MKASSGDTEGLEATGVTVKEDTAVEVTAKEDTAVEVTVREDMAVEVTVKEDTVPEVTAKEDTAVEVTDMEDMEVAATEVTSEVPVTEGTVTASEGEALVGATDLAVVSTKDSAVAAADTLQGTVSEEVEDITP